jgi:hypothetical protein
MADVSHRPGDLRGHPDVVEMRARYEQMLKGRDVVLVDGPVILAGVYTAISPWVVHFSAQDPNLTTNNLVLGIAIAVLGFGLTQTPSRMYGLSHAIALMGAWLILSPWVVTRFPDSGMIWNNVVIGAVTFLLGCAAAVTLMRISRQARASTTVGGPSDRRGTI